MEINMTDKEKLNQVKEIIASLEIPKGSISDGNHTFDELYEHRCILWIALCKMEANIEFYIGGTAGSSWKTTTHSSGDVMEGWFLLGMGKIKGEQITYHLPIKYWNDCEFAQILVKAPEYDGHSSSDVLERIKKLED
jgi:hypothetical protein